MRHPSAALLTGISFRGAAATACVCPYSVRGQARLHNTGDRMPMYPFAALAISIVQ